MPTFRGIIVFILHTWRAAGGGAHKYSEIFKEKLGVLLEKEDEMVCLVAGCNFFLKAIAHEAFMYESGLPSFVPTNGGWVGGLKSVVPTMPVGGVRSCVP